MVFAANVSGCPPRMGDELRWSLPVEDAVALAAVQDASRRYAVPFGPPWPPLRPPALERSGRDSGMAVSIEQRVDCLDQSAAAWGRVGRRSSRRLIPSALHLDLRLQELAPIEVTISDFSP